MPNTANARKRLRQNEKRRIANRGKRSALRTYIRKVRAAVQAGDVEKAGQELRVAVKKLDQAAADRLIHVNTASRLKSRLAASVKKVQKPAAA